MWKDSAFFLSNISNARIYSVHSVKIVTTVLHISFSCQPHILDPPNVFPILRSEATLWPRWGKNLEIWSKWAKVATLAFNSSKDFFSSADFDSFSHQFQLNIYEGAQMRHVGYLSLYHCYLTIVVAYCFTTLMMLLTIHG